VPVLKNNQRNHKDRLMGKDHGGNPVFRGTRMPVHRLAEVVPSRVPARTRCRRGSVRRFEMMIPSAAIAKSRRVGNLASRPA
jgi:hypothetical protein